MCDCYLLRSLSILMTATALCYTVLRVVTILRDLCTITEQYRNLKLTGVLSTLLLLGAHETSLCCPLS